MARVFIMGSRFRGSIEKDAMPKLHRYFGTPLTNWILNRIYRSNFSDIHCGIRGVTREALDRINITSRGWEYASEMVLKAARLKLISSEVPIKFYKDREGRLSHHLRVGWRSPWLAGWVNLKVMLVYAADSFLVTAGAALLVIGLVLSLGLAAGPVRIGRIGFSLYWMLLGVMCATLGYSSIQIGVLARLMHGLKPRFVERLQKIMGLCQRYIADLFPFLVFAFLIFLRQGKIAFQLRYLLCGLVLISVVINSLSTVSWLVEADMNVPAETRAKWDRLLGRTSRS